MFLFRAISRRSPGAIPPVFARARQRHAGAGNFVFVIFLLLFCCAGLMYFYFQRSRYLERELQQWRTGAKTLQNPAGASTAASPRPTPSNQPELPEVAAAPTPGTNNDAGTRAPRRSIIADNSTARLDETVPDVSENSLPSPQLRGPETPASNDSVLPAESAQEPSDGPLTSLPPQSATADANESASQPAPRDAWAERDRREAARQQEGAQNAAVNGMPANSDYARMTNRSAANPDTTPRPRAATSTPRPRPTPRRGPIRSIYDAPEAMPQ